MDWVVHMLSKTVYACLPFWYSAHPIPVWEGSTTSLLLFQTLSPPVDRAWCPQPASSRTHTGRNSEAKPLLWYTATVGEIHKYAEYCILCVAECLVTMHYYRNKCLLNSKYYTLDFHFPSCPSPSKFTVSLVYPCKCRVVQNCSKVILDSIPSRWAKVQLLTINLLLLCIHVLYFLVQKNHMHLYAVVLGQRSEHVCVLNNIA